jgi:hypothetical protein
VEGNHRFLEVFEQDKYLHFIQGTVEKEKGREVAWSVQYVYLMIPGAAS